jgi:hypothetical protein
MSGELVTCPHCGRRNRVPAAAPAGNLRAWITQAIRA